MLVLERVNSSVTLQLGDSDNELRQWCEALARLKTLENAGKVSVEASKRIAQSSARASLGAIVTRCKLPTKGIFAFLGRTMPAPLPDRVALEESTSNAYAGLVGAFSRHGWVNATALLERYFPDNRERAAVLTKLAELVQCTDSERAVALRQSAHSIDQSPFRAKRLGFMAFDAGNISEATRFLAAFSSDPRLQPSATRMRARIEGYSRMLVRLPEIPNNAAPAYDPIPQTLLYVASSCQPFHLSGYTVRTHALIKALKATAWQATCVARPGYPWDRSDACEPAMQPSVEHDGVTYSLMKGADLSRMAPDDYISMAAVQIEATALRTKPALIQAASDHMSALPALIAARRVGIPFIYEVRGLWELSAASRNMGWERTERYFLSNRLEALAACHADAVFCITRQLARELEEMGVSAARIHVLQNGGDPDIRESTACNRGLVAAVGLDPAIFTLGYAGSILFYEGLDDLLEAISQLVKSGSPVQALITGDGNHLPALRQKSSALGLDQFVRFTGKVTQHLAHQYLRSVDAAVLPRKRVQVCEIVSPLKPYEIMALETPLLTSDVAPLADLAERCSGAIALFQASNAQSLADAIKRLIEDSDLRRDMVRRGRDFLVNDGSWASVAKKMASVLDVVGSQAGSERWPHGQRGRDSGTARHQQRGELGREPSPSVAAVQQTDEVTEKHTLRPHLDRRLEELAAPAKLLYPRGTQLETTKGRVKVKEDEILALKKTLSWRVTAPLRLLTEYRTSRKRRPNLEREVALLEQSELFDAEWYLKHNRDVAKSGMNPAEHYLRYGAREGRKPGPEFDGRSYLESYPDVALARINPLVHYLEYGKDEGRDAEK